MSHHQKLIKEIVGEIETRRDSYGSVLVKSAIVKNGDLWENIVTTILPLKEPKNLFTTENCLRLFAKLRNISKESNIPARTIEKALFKKNYDKTKS